MKIAALIIGILAGLYGFPIATMGHALVGAGGGSGGSILYLLPIASLIGAGLVLNATVASGAILLGTAFFWLLMGAKAGYAINIVTIGPLALNAVAGILALAASGVDNASQSSAASPPINDVQAPPGDTKRYQYDQTKWRALLEFDSDIARVEEVLRPYGKKYVDQFAAGYFALNDKAYISKIIQKVIETARQDAAEAKAQEERWSRRFSDPVYVLKYARENFEFLVWRPYGNIAVLRNRSVLLEQNGQISEYSNPEALRDATNDREAWFDMPDEAKIHFVRLLALHIPN